MPNENVRFEEKLSLVQKQFLCGVPLVHFNWNSLLDDLCWERQSFLIDKTVDFDLVRKYPLKIDYQKAFVKFLIDRLLRKGNEIHDRVYEAFGRIVALPSSDFDNYKHYLNSGNVITIKENSKIISEGTTGLCTWQASLVLSEWCLSNKSALQDKNVLELGSGVGLAGISIALNCSPSKIYLSDCHKSVLEALRENVLINSSRFDELRNKIEIVELNWEEIDEEFLISTPNIDLVVCADVVYDRDLFEPLINAFCVFLQTNTKKIILACTERNRETLRSFLDKLEKNRIKCLGLEAPEQKTFVWDTSAPVRIFELSFQ